MRPWRANGEAKLHLKLKQAAFHQPRLDDIADAMAAGLAANYVEVAATVAPCPDLRDLGCAFAGLGGAPFLIEIGGEPYAHNPKYRDAASFDLTAIAAACGRPNAHILGAGFPSLVATNGRCGELMPCLALGGRSVSKIARVGPDPERQCLVEDYPSCLHGGLGNLYACDGIPGDVVKLTVRRRTGGEGSLSQAIRHAIAPLVDGDNHIALGGIFTVDAGQVRAHVSPDYDRIPFAYYDTVTNQVTRQDFLQFYEGMGPDLMCMSVLWTGDPTGGDLHLRPSHEHTHFFSTAGRQEAGHYHHDVTPDTIAYTGYFHTAQQIVRVNDIYAELAQQ